MIMMDKIYHFVGIKGSGMSSLATILKDQGYQVQGSDIDEYCFTQVGLEKNNIPMFSFDAKNIEKNTDQLVVIAGNAFSDDHVELKKAQELNVPIVRYHTFLKNFLTKFTSIAVTGSHGKTSTTGMLAQVFSHIKPTSYLIGDGTGKGVKEAQYFIFEACEYRRHFLSYEPDYAIMVNIDFDHPDYYQSLEDVTQAFSDFAKQVKKGIVAFGEDKQLRTLVSKTPIYYYGTSEDNDFHITDIKRCTEGSYFNVSYQGMLLGEFFVPAFGMHNIYNATSVIAMAYLEQLPMEEVATALAQFSGVKRRFSEKIVKDMIIVDDYAHHPAEIKATIDGAHQRYPDKEVIAVFQPHTFTRTIALMDEFGEALNLADYVYLCDIFASAREEHGDITIHDLASKIKQPGCVISEQNLSPLLNHKDAVILFMGAGDIQKFALAYEELLSHTRSVMI